MKDVTIGQEVMCKRPMLKFTSVQEGKVISVDAQVQKATVAFNDDTVRQVSFDQLTPRASQIVKAIARPGSLASKLGF